MGTREWPVERVFVVTHPEATHHVDHLVGGWFDSELTEQGRHEATLIAAALRDALRDAPGPVQLVTSDLRRTRQTADIIADALGVAPEQDAGLREKSYGVAGGRPQSWLDERFIVPPATGERLDHDEGVAGAETKLGWFRRVAESVSRITSVPARARVIVTHGGSATPVVAAWMRIPVTDCGWATFRVPSGSVTVLEEDGRFRNRSLTVLGSREHVPGAGR